MTEDPLREEPEARRPGGRVDDLAVLLLNDQALTGLLDTVVTVGSEAVPSLKGVSVTMLTEDASRYETTNASSGQIRSVDESQYASDSGPCIEAIRTRNEVQSAIPSRAWPEFSAAAEQASIRAVWSLPLEVQDRVPAALNFYSAIGSPWEDSMAGSVRLLARHAAAILDQGLILAQSEQVNVTLRRALETRTVIGQAQGVLMARQGVTPSDAFDILRRASQRTNRKLRDVAAEIVDGVSQGKHRP